MKTLLAIQFKYMAKIMGLAVLVEIPLVFVLSLFHINHEVSLYIFFFLNIFAAFAFGMMFSSQNLPWMMTLPISRIRLYILNYYWSVSNILWSLASYHVVAFVSRSIITSERQSLGSIAGKIVEFLFESGNLQIASYLALTLVIGHFSFSTVPADPKTRNEQLLRGFSNKKALTPLVLIGCAAVIFKSYFFSFFGVGFAILAFYITVLLPASTRNIGMPSHLLRKLQIGNFATVSAVLIALFGLNQKALRSDSFEKQISAYEILGAWSGKLDHASIDHLLSQDLNREQIESLQSHLRPKFRKKAKIAYSESNSFDVSKWIQSKSTPSALDQTLRIFRAETLNADILERFLIRHAEIKGSEDRNSLEVSRLLAIDTPIELLESWLESPHETLQSYALVKSRYLPEGEKLKSKITRKVKGYSDFNQLQALKSLAILSQEHLGLEKLEAIKSRKPASIKIATSKCPQSEDQVQALCDSGDAGLLNRCVRLKAGTKNAGLVRLIESHSWIARPYKRSEKLALSQALKCEID